MIGIMGALDEEIPYIYDAVLINIHQAKKDV